MLARAACWCRHFCRKEKREWLGVAKEAKSQSSLDVLKKKAGELKANSEPYLKE